MADGIRTPPVALPAAFEFDPFTGERLLTREQMQAIAEATQGMRENGIQHAERLVQNGWLTLSQAAEVTGLSVKVSLGRRALKLLQAQDPRVWQNPVTDVFLVHPQLVQEWKEAVNQEMALTQDRHWVRLDEAAKLSGVSYITAYKRTQKIPAEDRWEHPHSPVIFIRRTHAEQWRAAEEHEKQLKEAGSLQSVAIRTLGVANVDERVAAVKRQNPSHVWTHPYSNKTWVVPEIYHAWTHELEIGKANESTADALTQKGYLTLVQLAELTGIPRATLEMRVAVIAADQEYSFNHQPPLKGSDLVIRLPNRANLPSVYVHPLLAGAWQQKEAQRKQLAAQGWLTLTEAEQFTGIKRGTLSARCQRLDKHTLYNAHGMPAEKGETTYTADDLCFMDQAAYWINPLLLRNWKEEQDRASALQKQGYVSVAKAARVSGLATGLISLRLRRYEQEGRTIDGAPAACRKAYPTQDWLIHPSLLQEWCDQKEVEEDYIRQGYQMSSQVTQQCQLKHGAISRWTTQIQPDQLYGEDGLAPKLGQPTLIGAALMRRLVSGQVLLHPKLAASMVQAEQQWQALQSKGYLSFSQALKETGLSEATLGNRCRAVASQESPADRPAIWYHPYADTRRLIDGALVACWKQAEVQYSALKEAGWMGQAHVMQALQVNNIDKTMESIQQKRGMGEAEARWGHPFSNEVLISPQIIAYLKENRTAKQPTDTAIAQADHQGKLQPAARTRPPGEREGR